MTKLKGSVPIRRNPFRRNATLTLTLTLNPNFGETGFGESGFGESRRHQPLTLISANRVSAKREDTNESQSRLRSSLEFHHGRI